MLNYDLEKRKGKSIYEILYENLRGDIEEGRLKAGEKLPSKRAMAEYYGISVKTVVHAYEQLVAEGYLEAKEKRGYYVLEINEQSFRTIKKQSIAKQKQEKFVVDFSANHLPYQKFPISVWKKVMREVLTEYENELIESTDWRGTSELRNVIAVYLAKARGMTVSADNIIVGSGVESMYGKLFRIFPKEAVYATETPGYRKVPWLYESAGCNWRSVKMDEEGINIEELRRKEVEVVHVSPEHQYPLGITMSEKRKKELLEWAEEERHRYIIEDDYDCEFQYGTQLRKTLKSMDRHHRVIYMNTFGKTMAPAIRINYMILPQKLLEECKKTAERFPSPVPSCEQYTMARFVEKGCFERHLRRMKKYCEQNGRKLIRLLENTEKIPVKEIRGGKNGTHLLLVLHTELTDTELLWEAKQQGIQINCLSQFCTEKEEKYEHTLILNYADLSEAGMEEAVRRLEQIFEYQSIQEKLPVAGSLYCNSCI